MENMEDLCVSHNYTQRDLLLPPSPPHPAPAASAVAIQTYPRTAAAAAAISLKFYTKHVTNKNKTKHIMKISYINVKIYDKAATSQQNSD
jgi:hypothetical protein